MAKSNKTSTFTIHHGHCKPEAWTARDILAFAEFVKYGSMQYAARLSRLGVQLVLSEHHEPKGGDIEQLGYAPKDELAAFAENLEDLDLDDEIVEIVPMFRGQSVFVVRYGIDDGYGEFGGYEYEIKPTEVEAEAFLKSLRAEDIA